SLGGFDGSEHFRAGSDAEPISDSLLKPGKEQTREVEPRTPRCENRAKVDASEAAVVDERLVAASVELDRHGIWTNLFDHAPDLLDAPLRDVCGAEEVDLLSRALDPDHVGAYGGFGAPWLCRVGHLAGQV